jgi:hypothetical protein
VQKQDIWKIKANLNHTNLNDSTVTNTIDSEVIEIPDKILRKNDLQESSMKLNGLNRCLNGFYETQMKN